MMQDKYEEDMDVVIIPAFAILALHFLVRYAVDGKSNHTSKALLAKPVFDASQFPVTTEARESDSADAFNLREDIPFTDFPYGIKLINGMYQFRGERFLRINDAVFAAELIFDKEKSFEQVRSKAGDRVDVYSAIASELESGAYDKGLWIKLYAEFNGDETKTKVQYIKERAIILTAQLN